MDRLLARIEWAFDSMMLGDLPLVGDLDFTLPELGSFSIPDSPTPEIMVGALQTYLEGLGLPINVDLALEVPHGEVI